VQTLLTTLQSERRNLEGAKAVVRAVEASSRNEAVIQQAQNEVRSAQATIDFLENELAKVQLGSGGGASPSRPGRGEGSGSDPALRGYGNPAMSPSRSTGSSQGMGPGAGAGMNQSQSQNWDRDRPLPPPPPGAQDVAAPKRAEPKNYTQLGKITTLSERTSS
jgi:classical protein kinase C/novel protein kinase C epsilon type